jgi:hypothetical protein
LGATSVLHIEDTQGNGPAFIFDVNNKRDILAHYDDGTEKFALMSNGFIRTTSGYKYRQAVIGIGDIAANNDAYTYPLLRAKSDITIVEASIGCDATVAANATNYQTIYLEQSGNTTDLSSLTTASTGFTAGTPRDFTIATTGDPDHLKAGQTLQLRIVKAASGVAMYGVVVHITYTIDQPETTPGTATDNVFRIMNEVGTAAVITHDHDQRDHLSVRRNGVEQFKIDCNGKMHGGETHTPVDLYFYHVVNVGTITTSDSKKCPIFSPHCDVKIHSIFYGASSSHLADSNSAYWNLKLTDGTDMLADFYIHGPYGGAVDLTKGLLYNVGDIAKAFEKLTSSDRIQLEPVEVGTAPDITGLTVVVCFTKES